jgi:glycosyltransferase involved in cell wall biosynthesis
MKSGYTTFKTLQIGRAWFPELPGGLDRVYYQLMSQFRLHGVNAQGLVVGSQDVFATSGGRVVPFAPAAASLIRRLHTAREATYEAIIRGRPQIIGAHFALFALPALDLFRDIPLVIHFHGPWAAELAFEANPNAGQLLKRYLAHLIECRVYRKAVRFIVLSEAFSDVLARTYGVPENLISVIPGGVDLASFAAGESKLEARRLLHIDIHRPLIISIRRLARRMGLGVLLDAMLEVRHRFPESLLLIGGKGPLERELQQQIDKNGLADNVRLLGFVSEEDLRLLYRAADFTVIPSMSLEGFGLTSLESLASGTPVLVTPIGGLPEIVRGLSRELILPGISKTDIADGIVGALGGTRTLPSKSECTAYVHKTFSWDKMGEAVVSLYRALL